MSAEPATGSPPEPALVRSSAGSNRLLVAAACALAGALVHTTASNAAPVSRTARSSPIARYADGAPAGFSGGFAEDSCHACHFGADINTAPGSVTVTGVPARFVAGERYRLTVTLTRTGMALGGFQLTARFKDGGTQAGTLTPAPTEDERIVVEFRGGIQYVSQRLRGTALTAPDTARWALDWTAPTGTGPVLFHVAANAADKDESAQGDYVFTAMVQSDPGGAPR